MGSAKLKESASSFKNTQILTSQNETNAMLKNEPLIPLFSVEKKTNFAKNPEENTFLRNLISNNKNLQNYESAEHRFYMPSAGITSKDGSVLDEANLIEHGIKEFNSKNFPPDSTNLSARPLNFNEFLQLFAINNLNNSGGDDYLRFLNLNSNRMSAAGLNTGGRPGFGNVPAKNINQLLKEEIRKEEEEEEAEGDSIKKKRKIE